MFFIDFDPFLFFLIGFDCFEHDRGVWLGQSVEGADSNQFLSPPILPA